MKVNVKVKLYPDKVKALETASKSAMEKTADAILTDITTRQVVPRDSGTLEGSGHVVKIDDVYSIIFSTPYARRLYWHPEYNFRTDKNPNAQGKWMDYYMSGEGLEWVITTYMTFLKEFAGGLIT
ncbi:MAG: minor capsid protein [Coprobacillaceae bacterium]